MERFSSQLDYNNIKITGDILRERVNWSLEKKIDHALGAIEQWLNYYDSYVSFSGGKDSTVLLWLVKIINPNIDVVFFNTTNEFPEIYQFIKTVKNLHRVEPEMNLKKVIDKYGFPLISKEQAQYIREVRNTKSEKVLNVRLNGVDGKGKGFCISNKWKHLIDAPFDVSEKCCYHLKKKPAIKFEKETGLKPIIGTMASESSLRKQKYLKTGCNAFNLKRPASYPISIFTVENIWDIIRKYNLPYCSVYDKGETQTGCVVCGFGCQYDDRFKRLKNNYPRHYEIGMNLKNKGVTYREAIQIALKNYK
jgi:3'-phosphoadenosine 5'-phosphosulfate sulfotransferase (PAPS reductase)/FAD synthetase